MACDLCWACLHQMVSTSCFVRLHGRVLPWRSVQQECIVFYITMVEGQGRCRLEKGGDHVGGRLFKAIHKGPSHGDLPQWPTCLMAATVIEWHLRLYPRIVLRERQYLSACTNQNNKTVSCKYNKMSETGPSRTWMIFGMCDKITICADRLVAIRLPMQYPIMP